MKFALLALLLLPACLRAPCNPADELDAIEAGKPTCTALRAQEKAAMNERRRVALLAAFQPAKHYQITIGSHTAYCTEDSSGNVTCD